MKRSIYVAFNDEYDRSILGLYRSYDDAMHAIMEYSRTELEANGFGGISEFVAKHLIEVYDNPYDDEEES